MATKQYLILSETEIPQIDWLEVLETSADTLRRSNDGRVVIKWYGLEPMFVYYLQTKEGPYNYEEIIEIMKLPEWSTDPTIY
jgi:hypothetical protein